MQYKEIIAELQLLIRKIDARESDVYPQGMRAGYTHAIVVTAKMAIVEIDNEISSFKSLWENSHELYQGQHEEVINELEAYREDMARHLPAKTEKR